MTFDYQLAFFRRWTWIRLPLLYSVDWPITPFRSQCLLCYSNSL